MSAITDFWYLIVITVPLLWFFLKWKSIVQRVLPGGSRQQYVIGIFHPYCNSGGGGERVLWMAITSIQHHYPHIRCVIYTGDLEVSKQQMFENVKKRFNITLNEDLIDFVYLRYRWLIEADRYKVLTILGQSIGSAFLGLEALLRYSPEIYFDTMGWAFTYPVARLFGCKVACYTHYPTISTDMIQKIENKENSFNNQETIAKSTFLTTLKLWYYKVFAIIYGWCGRCSSVVMVNSTWTHGHIKALWSPQNLSIVYPPCATKEFASLKLNNRKKVLLSVAQFRPEKNHKMQLYIVKTLLDINPQLKKEGFRLILVGGCRNDEDSKRVQNLKDIAKKLDISEFIDFRVNCTFDELKQLLGNCLIGLHTMKDEHFGIGIVEYMASGLIPIAHNSAGPKQDIIQMYKGMQTGFLASSESEYCSSIMTILCMPGEQLRQIQENARESVSERFSDDLFIKRVAESLSVLVL